MELLVVAADVGDAVDHGRRGHDWAAGLEGPFDAFELPRSLGIIHPGMGEIAAKHILGKHHRQGRDRECNEHEDAFHELEVGEGSISWFEDAGGG
jgi:hypothetical protein